MGQEYLYMCTSKIDSNYVVFCFLHTHLSKVQKEKKKRIVEELEKILDCRKALFSGLIWLHFYQQMLSVLFLLSGIYRCFLYSPIVGQSRECFMDI